MREGFRFNRENTAPAPCNLKSKMYAASMNAQTRVSAKGQVVIPKDVRERLHWNPGTRLEVVETLDGVSLKAVRFKNPFPPTNIEDLWALPPWSDEPRSIEEISRLSDEALREIFAEQERNAGG